MTNKSTIILDDVIDEDFFETFQKNLQNNLNESTRETWFFNTTKHHYQEFCLSFMNLASTYYNLSSCDGYEFWIHCNTKPPTWHIDNDERRRQDDNVMIFPLCSIVYYPKIINLTGGELCISHNEKIGLYSSNQNYEKIKEHLKEDEGISDIIAPKQNRMIIFPPGKLHKVNQFEGTRISFVINPWNSKNYSHPN